MPEELKKRARQEAQTMKDQGWGSWLVKHRYLADVPEMYQEEFKERVVQELEKLS